MNIEGSTQKSANIKNMLSEYILNLTVKQSNEKNEAKEREILA